MSTNKQPLAVAITLVLGVCSANTAYAARLDLNFMNNATPGANPLHGGIPFQSNTEFRLVTPSYGSVNDGHKDAMFGGENWTFSGSNIVGALMTGVSGTDTNSGSSNSAPITSGLSGFPVCQTAGTCVTLQQNVDLLGAGPLSVIAPIVGSETENAFGAAVVQKFNPGDAGNDIEIFFPVIHYQWNDGTYVLGSDPIRTSAGTSRDGSFVKGAGPGALFFGETDGAGGFRLLGQTNLDTTNSEGHVAGISNAILQWDLVGTYATSAIPVPASIWLFGSGLVGLAGLRRRRRMVD